MRLVAPPHFPVIFHSVGRWKIFYDPWHELWRNRKIKFSCTLLERILLIKGDTSTKLAEATPLTGMQVWCRIVLRRFFVAYAKIQKILSVSRRDAEKVCAFLGRLVAGWKAVWRSVKICIDQPPPCFLGGLKKKKCSGRKFFRKGNPSYTKTRFCGAGEREGGEKARRRNRDAFAEK